MKKIFLMVAFAGLLVGANAMTTGHDDKDKGKKEAKACCKSKEGADGKACAGDKKDEKACDKKEGKSCCKAKQAETK
ncbi:MAG: hypothetical protein IT237_08840 [Bacteroidia bacterium]|nr:hypothetical protein [Bacteroidia bacterium]